MDRATEDQLRILTGTPAWSATPDDDSSLRSVRLKPDGTGTVVYGDGQTICSMIDCRFEAPGPGRIRFEYLDTPQPQRRPPHSSPRRPIGRRRSASS